MTISGPASEPAPADLHRSIYGRRQSSTWTVCLLVLIPLLVLGRVCFDQFTTWDDEPVLRTNTALLPPTLASIGQYWKAPSGSLYIPLTYTVWGLISWATQTTNGSGQIAQLPWGFHTASLAVHLASSLVVFRILSMLKLAQFACFCGAMLFAVHPIQVEAVAWASGLKDVLAGCLALLALQQYLAFAIDHDRSGAGWSYVRASAWFIAAALAKPSAMTLPLCAAAIDRWGVGRPWRRVLPPAAAWLIVAVPVAIVARLVQEVTYSPQVPLWERPFIVCDSITFYLGKLLWPFDMGIDYGRSPPFVMAGHLWYWEWLLPLIIAIALIARRRQTLLLVLAGLLFLFGCLPVLGFAISTFQYESTTADHYLYFSMIGPALALGWLVNRFGNVAVRAITLLALSLLCVRSADQISYWKDDRSLWSHEIKVNPNSFPALLNLGALSAVDGDYGLAEARLKRAAAIHPDWDLVHDYLAHLYWEANRPADAISQERQTLELESHIPSNSTIRARHTAELGVWLFKANRIKEALPYLQTAHAMAPHDPKIAEFLRRATTQATTQG
jgi:hypothetical protein